MRVSADKWTIEEDEILKDQTKTNEEIAAILGRTEIAVSARRHRVTGHSTQMIKAYKLDLNARGFSKKNIRKLRDQTRIGDEVTVMATHYGISESSYKIKEKARVIYKTENICVTDKGDFQWKEIHKWSIGGDFI